MECNVPSCPHRQPDDIDCPLGGFTEDPERPELNPEHGLVAASLELGRLLADHGKVTFRAQGTCMFPCIRPGDTLTIRSCSIDQVRVGDIVVFRRGGILFGHRAIATGTSDGKSFVETRPDRSGQGTDGPSYAEDVLGIIVSIKRNNADVPLRAHPLGDLASLQVSGWEWWHWKARPLLIVWIGRVQRTSVYRHVATELLRKTEQQRHYVVKVPMSARSLHDLYRQFPAEQFEPSRPLWKGKPPLRWTISVQSANGTGELGEATVTWHPRGCPRGEGWRIEKPKIQPRYRGAGLEDILFEKAQHILARSRMTLQKGPE